MSTQIQRRRGTTAEHSTFTGALAETTIDTDKDTVVVHDGTTVGGHPLLRENGSNSALALGSAGTPSLKFNGDPNTGIYSPGADQVAISTNGAGRLFVDSSGRVAVGNSNPGAPFDVIAARGTLARFQESGSPYNGLRIVTDATGVTLTSNSGTGYFGFNTGGSERMRLDSSGRLGLGTSAPDFTLDVNGTIGITEGQPVSWHDGSGNLAARIYATSGDELRFERGSGASRSMTIDSSGRVGIGTTSPGQQLTVETASGNCYIEAKRASQSAGQVAIALRGGTSGADCILYQNTNSNDLNFYVNGNDRARIDSSGRLLVGTSNRLLDNANDLVQVLGDGGGGIVLGLNDPSVFVGNTLGKISFAGRDATGSVYAPFAEITAQADDTHDPGDNPTRLVFSTCASGSSSPTERMRLSQDGRFYLSGGWYTNITTANAANVHAVSSGEFYRSTSSIKYKTDVETLQDVYADAILNVRPVWYRSLGQNDNPTYGWWGFIAEEVAEIDPRLVQWKTIEVTYDENGSKIETPCEPEPDGVQYDRFVPHLLNLIKRQKEQIEAQGTAIAALEARLSALEAQ